MLNYDIYRTDRITHKGGGAAIIVNRSIKHTYIEIANAPAGMEVTTVKVKCNPIGDIYVTSCYNPPKNKIDPSFCNLFHANHPSVVGGDLNAKNRIWHSRLNNDNGEELERIINASSIFVDAPTEFTHEPRDPTKQGDVLDVFCFRNVNNYYTIDIHKKMDSDHWPIILNLYNYPIGILKKSPKCVNWNNFKEVLSDGSQSGTHLYTTIKDIDIAVQSITEKITQAIHRSTFIKANATNPFELPTYIRSAITIRNRARKNWQKSHSNEDKSEYNGWRSYVKKLITEHRNKAWSSFIENLNTEDNSLWDITRKLLKKNKPIPPLTVNGTKIFEEEQKANILANIYEQQFRTSTANVNQRHHNINKYIKAYTKAEKVFIRNDTPTFKLSEMKLIIKNLKNNKAPGYDNITNKAIKHLPENILKELLRIVNSCTRKSYFPQDWKFAIIKPLHKAGKKENEPDGYRPISLLPSLSKIFERLINKHLIQYLDKNKIIQDEQFGFRSRHSTVHQLNRFTEHAHNCYEVGGKTVVLFLDISKAFDQIWQNGLLLKCKVTGMPTWLLLLICSFLTNRRFKVRINGALSEEKYVMAGVPQGSVLGPTLFNLYMCDLRLDKPARLALYADDAAIFVSDTHKTRIVKKLQNYIPKVENFYRFWRLQINTEKSKAMFISRNVMHDPVDKIKIFNQEVEWVKNYKYLGVTLDKSLTFKTHVENKIKKANATKAQIYPLISRKSKLSQHNKILIYVQLLLPALLYACVAWNTISEATFKKLNQFQNQFIKQALNVPWFVRGEVVQKELGLISIPERVYNYTLSYYENLDDHPNPLIQDTVKYALGKWRKRKRPRDYLLKKPP